MPKVRIQCPSCKRFKLIDLSNDILKIESRTIIAINISQDLICSHSFIAYIDKNFKVRDYFIADFQIELPEVSSVSKLKDEEIRDQNLFNMDLVKLNLLGNELAYILKSIFVKKRIVIILDEASLHEHYIHFFDYITKDNFKTEITVLTQDTYKNQKNQYIDSMVFENNEIINNVNKIINPKRLQIEKEIVKRFLNAHELSYSFITLKNELQKSYELSKSIVDFIQKAKINEEKVNILNITTNLEKIYGVKINPTYLNFLIEIIENYFEISLPSIAQSFLDII